jgi:hypothetical protein
VRSHATGLRQRVVLASTITNISVPTRIQIGHIHSHQNMAFSSPPVSASVSPGSASIRAPDPAACSVLTAAGRRTGRTGQIGRTAIATTRRTSHHLTEAKLRLRRSPRLDRRLPVGRLLATLHTLKPGASDTQAAGLRSRTRNLRLLQGTVAASAFVHRMLSGGAADVSFSSGAARSTLGRRANEACQLMSCFVSRSGPNGQADTPLRVCLFLASAWSIGRIPARKRSATAAEPKSRRRT